MGKQAVIGGGKGRKIEKIRRLNLGEQREQKREYRRFSEVARKFVKKAGLRGRGGRKRKQGAAFWITLLVAGERLSVRQRALKKSKTKEKSWDIQSSASQKQGKLLEILLNWKKVFTIRKPETSMRTGGRIMEKKMKI